LKVYIIGLPGSGKTTLGRQLAQALHLPFFDLDHAIEAEAKQTVQQIFATQGEGAFRKKEAEALRKITGQQAAFVMATGGGTPCFYHNMDFMNEEGITLFLQVPPEVIRKRLSAEEAGKRPLLQQATLEQLLQARLPFYIRAKYTVAETDLPAIVQLLTVLRK
jgi:shikimate kinase